MYRQGYIDGHYDVSKYLPFLVCLWAFSLYIMMIL